MNDAFASITGRIHAFISQSSAAPSNQSEVEAAFNALAVELYTLQLHSVPAYRQFCQRKDANSVKSWEDIPALPISAFKQTDVTSLSPSERSHVFYSSGTVAASRESAVTSADERSRHYHSADSLRLYQTSLVAGFRLALVGASRESAASGAFPLPQVAPLPPRSRVALGNALFVSLTPPASSAPHSSLVHMLQVLGQDFLGSVDSLGNWQIQPEVALPALAGFIRENVPVLLFGTAFNFVHLLDALDAQSRRLVLPADSRIIETGGYKGRSRVLSRPELYERIHHFLGLPPSQILSEYGMCELSSQAYDDVNARSRAFRFSPWARFRVVSPEDGRTLPFGEPGLLQVFDLANVRSVLAIQTEDIAVSTPGGFELLGRATDAQPRGCSLMMA